MHLECKRTCAYVYEKEVLGVGEERKAVKSGPILVLYPPIPNLPVLGTTGGGLLVRVCQCVADINKQVLNFGDVCVH